MKALLSTALFILLTPLFIQAGETMKANRAECFYIIRFKPEVRYKEAAKILEDYGLKIVHVYKTLSEASGTLIVSAETGECNGSLEKRVSENSSVISVKIDSAKSLEAPPEDRRSDSNASGFSVLFGVSLYLSFLAITFFGLGAPRKTLQTLPSLSDCERGGSI